MSAPPLRFGEGAGGRGSEKSSSAVGVRQGKADERAESTVSTTQTLRQRMAELMHEQHLDEKAALKIVAKERGVSKSEAYRQWQAEKTLSR